MVDLGQKKGEHLFTFFYAPNLKKGLGDFLAILLIFKPAFTLFTVIFDK
jgi:hypothetical protein